MTWIRVRDRDTGHEFDVAEASFDGTVHEDLNRPWDGRDPRPAKPRTNKAGEPMTGTPDTETSKKEA